MNVLRCLAFRPCPRPAGPVRRPRGRGAPPARRPALHFPRGFTLIELLVALALMALMALMSWRGIDGMLRTQEQTRTRADALLVLQTALGQWGADLDAMLALPNTVPIDWDGQVLRITRRSSAPSDEGALVVAWTRRGTATRRAVAALAVAPAAHARRVAASLAAGRAMGAQPQQRRPAA